jgi:hypothetical protein
MRAMSGFLSGGVDTVKALELSELTRFQSDMARNFAPMAGHFRHRIVERGGETIYVTVQRRGARFGKRR